MTDRFVRGTTGNNANSGADWNNAKQSVAGALAIASSGDTVYVDNGESFTATAAITWTPPAGGNVAIISCVRSGTTTVAWDASTGTGAGAAESVGAASNAFNLADSAGSSMYVFGMTLNGGTNVNSACSIGILSASAASSAYLNYCTFDLKAAATATINFYVGSSSIAPNITCANCTFICSGSRAGTFLSFSNSNCVFINPTFSTTGGTKPAVLMGPTSTASTTIIVQDGDLTGYAVSGGAYFAATTYRMNILVQNCKISATPAILSGTLSSSSSITLRNVDSADTINVFQYQTLYGTLTVDATTYLTAGLQFNATGVSWKIVTSASANEFTPFVSPVTEIWCTSTAAQTAEIEIVRNSATALTNREIWSDMSYSATAAFPTYAYATSRNTAPYSSAGVDQATSSAAWTGTGGFGNVTKQKLQIGFTAAEIGLLQSRVFVGKATETVYLNSTITNVT